MADVLPYLLPDLGEGMTEAELVQWRVAVGEHVTPRPDRRHVQTDKAEVELPVRHQARSCASGPRSATWCRSVRRSSS